MRNFNMTQIKKSWVFIKWSKNCFISGAEKGRIDVWPDYGEAWGSALYEVLDYFDGSYLEAKQQAARIGG
tara:strand:+ start:258 stop:467 length:210 start_codon:yes stop_codon:yes gene_type:complete